MDPSVGRKDLLKKYKERGFNGKYADRHAMVEAMDESVGRVRKSLEAKGIADNTVIIVLSDQGGAYSNAPLRGGKKGGDTLAEGGARVPFMIYYPGVTKPNSVCHTPVQSIDVFPKLVEIVKAEVPNKTDGISIVPELLGGKQKKHDFLYCETQEGRSVKGFRQATRFGKWKAVRYGDNYHTELYKLDNDLFEEHDVSSKNPKLVAKANEILKRESVKDEHYPNSGGVFK